MTDIKPFHPRLIVDGTTGILPSKGHAARLVADFGAKRTVEPDSFTQGTDALLCLVAEIYFDRTLLIDGPDALEYAKARQWPRTWWRVPREYERLARACRAGGGA